MAVSVRPAKEADRLAVSFRYSRARVEAIRSVPGSRWYPDRRCWTIRRTENTVARLREAFAPEPIEAPELESRDVARGSGGAAAPEPLPTDVRRRHLERATEELKLRGYSPHTRKAHLGHVRRLLEASPSGEPPDGRGLRTHLLQYPNHRSLSHAYVNQCVSALKFFYDRVLGREAPVAGLPRPRRDRKLPAVLGRSEVARVLAAVTNAKHRALLMLTYAAGLRVGEVVRLRVSDLDVERRLLTVRHGKGRKDRRVMLSERALAAVRAHLGSRLPAVGGRDWLFRGARIGRHLTVRSAQRVFKRALRTAGVEKDVGIHALLPGSG